MVVRTYRTDVNPSPCITRDTALAMDVSIRDLRNKGGEVVDRAARGEPITITRAGKPVAELRPVARRGVSAAALLARVLPDEPVIAAVTLAELSMGPLIADDEEDRAARQAHVQQAEADFDPFHSMPAPRAPLAAWRPRCGAPAAKPKPARMTR
jgi:prevent-host-death family protein